MISSKLKVRKVRALLRHWARDPEQLLPKLPACRLFSSAQDINVNGIIQWWLPPIKHSLWYLQ